MLQQHLPHVRHAKLGLAGPHEGEHDRGRRDGTGDVAQSHRALLTEEGKGDMPLLRELVLSRKRRNSGGKVHSELGCSEVTGCALDEGSVRTNGIEDRRGEGREVAGPEVGGEPLIGRAASHLGLEGVAMQLGTLSSSRQVALSLPGGTKRSTDVPPPAPPLLLLLLLPRVGRGNPTPRLSGHLLPPTLLMLLVLLLSWLLLMLLS